MPSAASGWRVSSTSPGMIPSVPRMAGAQSGEVAAAVPRLRVEPLRRDDDPDFEVGMDAPSVGPAAPPNRCHPR